MFTQKQRPSNSQWCTPSLPSIYRSPRYSVQCSPNFCNQHRMDKQRRTSHPGLSQNFNGKNLRILFGRLPPSFNLNLVLRDRGKFFSCRIIYISFLSTLFITTQSIKRARVVSWEWNSFKNTCWKIGLQQTIERYPPCLYDINLRSKGNNAQMQLNLHHYWLFRLLYLRCNLRKK